MKSVRNWEEVLDRYHVRSGTFEEFVKAEGVNGSTLRYHLQKERQSKTGSFFPIDLGERVGEVELEFSSGLRLRIRG